jgi:hypothetical protein
MRSDKAKNIDKVSFQKLEDRISRIEKDLDARDMETFRAGLHTSGYGAMITIGFMVGAFAGGFIVCMNEYLSK